MSNGSTADANQSARQKAHDKCIILQFLQLGPDSGVSRKIVKLIKFTKIIMHVGNGYIYMRVNLKLKQEDL
jgi:hypothetical protein